MAWRAGHDDLVGDSLMVAAGGVGGEGVGVQVGVRGAGVGGEGGRVGVVAVEDAEAGDRDCKSFSPVSHSVVTARSPIRGGCGAGAE